MDNVFSLKGKIAVNEIGPAAIFSAPDVSKCITSVYLPVDGGNAIGF